MRNIHLVLGCAGLLAWGAHADGDPLKFPSYRQEIVATFADAAAAAKAELTVAPLPDGAARAFATRWDDATPRHVEKAAMLERAGVKGDFYFNGRENVPVPPWAANLVAHGHAVGNHTLDHPYMYKLSADEAYRQILLERIRLETALGITVNSYVSPYGWGGKSWNGREAKREVLRSVVETGHWVSSDNPLGIPEFPGDIWMPANRFSANDKAPDRELFEKGLRDQIAAADRNPLVPRIVLGTHSWCDEAGNALQEELLRKHCVRPDWVQLNDWDYGAYRYSALHAQAKRLGADAATARFSLVRYEPVSLASAIPLSVSFSSDPVSVTCGGRPLARGKNGTWALPHDSDRAPRLAAVVSNAWNGVTVALVPDFARRSVRVTVANGSAEEVRNLAVAVMTPPGCGVRRLAFTVPALGKGASCTRELAFGEAKDGRPDSGSGTALFAANADLDARVGRVRIWAWTAVQEGRKP